jgi:hypothetical protein
MKHTNIMAGTQATAKRNRGTGILNWAHLIKLFPTHASHIVRIRKDQKKLLELRNKLAVRFGIAGNIVYPRGAHEH